MRAASCAYILMIRVLVNAHWRPGREDVVPYGFRWARVAVVAAIVAGVSGRAYGGQQALSARLIDHLLLHPKWQWTGRDVTDLWVTGAAIADGFSVWEAWLGPYVVRSRTRTTDLPAMVAGTLGAAFTVMDRHQDLWLEVRDSEPVPTVGQPQPVSLSVICQQTYAQNMPMPPCAKLKMPVVVYTTTRPLANIA